MITKSQLSIGLWRNKCSAFHESVLLVSTFLISSGVADLFNSNVVYRLVVSLSIMFAVLPRCESRRVKEERKEA